MTSRTKLGEILIDSGLVTPQQLGVALEEQGQSGERLGQVLVRLGAIDKEQLSGALTEQTRRWIGAGLTAGFLAMHPGMAVARTATTQLSVSVEVMASAVVNAQSPQAVGAEALPGSVSLTCGGGSLMRVTYERAHIELQNDAGVVSPSPYVPARQPYLLHLQPLGRSVVSCGMPGQNVAVMPPTISLQGDEMNVEIAY